LFGEVDLPPAALLSQVSDSLAKLDANIRGHSSSIDLVEALYLVDALSVDRRAKPSAFRRVGQTVPARGYSRSSRLWNRRRTTPDSYEIFNQSADRTCATCSA
jgi:hypothetical protein